MQATKLHYHFAKYSPCHRHKKYGIALLQTVPINRGPIVPRFQGTAPVLWTVNSSVLVSRKISVKTPNMPCFSKS